MKKKEYLFLFLVVLVLSFVFALPHVLIPKLLDGKPYFPLVLDGAPIFTSDELTWPAAEAREIMDGRLLPTDSVVWEHKNAPSLTAQIPVIIIGLLGRVTGSINNAYILLGYVMPPLTFLAIFVLAILLTKEYLISSLISAAVMVITRPFQFFPPLNKDMAQALFSYLTNKNIDPSPVEFFRLPNPLLIFPFLMLTLIFLYLTLEKKKSILAVLGGIFFGLLFYVYFYFWTFILAGIGLMLVFSFIKRDWPKVKLLMVVLSVGGVISFFYWLNFFKFQQYPFREDVLVRAGIEMGRIRNLFRTVQFLTLSFLFAILIKKKDLKFWFLQLFLLGGVICLNIQLITGYTFQSSHWTLRVINPWIIIILGFGYFRLFGHKKFYKLLTVCLLFLILGLGFWTQRSFSLKAYGVYTLPGEKAKAFEWLDQNTPTDSVVGSFSTETNTLIPVYTHNNVFLGNGGVTLAGNAEIIRRIYVIYQIFQITPEYLDDILSYSEAREAEKEKNCKQNQCLRNRKMDYIEKQGAWFFFHMKSSSWRETLLGWSYKIGLANEEREKIVDRYRQILTEGEYQAQDWRLDYLFFGPEEKKVSSANLKNYRFLELVFRQGGVEIYRIKK